MHPRMSPHGRQIILYDGIQVISRIAPTLKTVAEAVRLGEKLAVKEFQRLPSIEELQIFILDAENGFLAARTARRAP